VNVVVSDSTVRRALREAELETMEKPIKPQLSNKNVKERLKFAKQDKFWTIEDWKHVIFSDETKISRFCSDGRSWCWLRDGESKKRRHIKETVKHGGGSVMVWGCMTAYILGFMCRILGTMDQYLSKSILEDELLKIIQWFKVVSSSNMTTTPNIGH
jgi:Transposase